MTITQPLRALGYARVSTIGQTLEVQLAQLAAVGCSPIYREKASGAKADRRELNRLLREVQPGDVVIVTRIDRLARSIFDLFSIVQRIHQAGATFRSLAQEWADTGTAQGRMMLAVMGGMAEVEREMILTRTAEGRARVKAAGGRTGGPKPKLTPAQQREIAQRLAGGEMLAPLAITYNVSRQTIGRLRTKPETAA
ncbi:recombinase family protein [Methylobacterium terricola]|uniref:Recombinase family protein n=1 Tax=Methylobacterium terricola TaxID=2583531 RepID=A0A5C4L7S7_9HYPH|nr:recombinase family protein [Methylobacterium terricola]TNC07621.1 recombinase family protein [Methylobacterium terricola]